MTLEEAIVLLKIMFAFWANTHSRNVAGMEMALNMALTALRPVSREQVERMRSRWITVAEVNGEQYSKCAACQTGLDGLEDAYLFCPHCGAPMTDEAVEIRLKELEALKDGKGD